MAGRKGVKHLNYVDRLKIEALYANKKTAKEIAAYLGRDLSCIYKELKRGQYERLTTDLRKIPAYSADRAQQDYDSKATAKGAPLKLGKNHRLAKFIESAIMEEKFSPVAVSFRIAQNWQAFGVTLCARTIYNYIEQHVFLRLSRTHLPRGGRTKRREGRGPAYRLKRPLCQSIEDRPKDIASRADFGHWEMDTVVGIRKGSGPVLLVLTERATRQEIILKMRAKTAAETVRCLNRLERQYGARFRQVFQTITVDNGSEFMDFEGMQRSCLSKIPRTKIYYCHPYSSWERGSNENANGLIRRFIPKGTPISDYTNTQIKQVEQWMNHYPRRILGGECSDTLFKRYLLAL